MDKREVDSREHENYRVKKNQVSSMRPFDSSQIKVSLVHITSDFFELIRSLCKHSTQKLQYLPSNFRLSNSHDVRSLLTNVWFERKYRLSLLPHPAVLFSRLSLIPDILSWSSLLRLSHPVKAWQMIDCLMSWQRIALLSASVQPSRIAGRVLSSLVCFWWL